MMTTHSVESAVALVTGASSGIGEATARVLAARGATVVLVARRRDRLEALATEIERSGGKALALEADIANREQGTGCVQQAVDALGRLDIVVNNAGVMLLGPAETAPLDEWERMIAVNLSGVLHVTHAALPHLLDAAESSPRGVADLVNVSSVAGRKAAADRTVYNLTKHGVGAFSEALRQEVTKRHVRVSLVEPGVVATELLDHTRPEIRERLVKGWADMEPLDSEDVAEAIEYIVTRPRHVAVNEVLIRPTGQVF
jgi:NADP-dependent 3-hydroxy acid dehydrogenase YdfG